MRSGIPHVKTAPRHHANPQEFPLNFTFTATTDATVDPLDESGI